jgi:TrpR family trp operon transcriptional repressor
MYKLKELSRIFAATDNEQMIEAFLKSILTKNEIDEISSRWELVKLLQEGMSQRKIADKLGLSLCKITRGSRELKKMNSPFKAFLKKYAELQHQRQNGDTTISS